MMKMKPLLPLWYVSHESCGLMYLVCHHGNSKCVEIGICGRQKGGQSAGICRIHISTAEPLFQ